MEITFHSNAVTDIEKKAHDKILELMSKAKELGFDLPRDKGYTFSLKFDLNSVNTAGTASFNKLKKSMNIRLHRKGLDFYKDEFIERTVVHEFVHILQFCRYGYGNHKTSFKHFMMIFNSDPERCHSFDLRSLVGKPKRKNSKNIKVQCGCIENHEVSPLIQKRMRSGITYRCRICKQKLKEI